MKTILRTLAGWAMVALLATPTFAQAKVPAGNVLGADDTDVAILVKHLGSSAEAAGEVAVAAGGDITFTASTVAVDDFECPISGALGGVIDVSDAACDTIGEVVDIINGNCTGCVKGNWVAVILDGQRGDSSNNSLLTISATGADAKGGLELKWDTDTVGFTSSIAIVPVEARSIEFYLGGLGSSRTLKSNPFANTQAQLLQANATSTYGSGTSIYYVRSIAVANAANNGLNTETAHPIYAEVGGATTANKLFGGTMGFGGYGGLWGRKGEKLLARLVNSAASASTFHAATGLFHVAP